MIHRMIIAEINTLSTAICLQLDQGGQLPSDLSLIDKKNNLQLDIANLSQIPRKKNRCYC
mgnify:FL=1